MTNLALEHALREDERRLRARARSATATCWRCCRRSAGSSAARTPGTSSASTSTPPATASSRRCRCCARLRRARIDPRESAAGTARSIRSVCFNVPAPASACDGDEEPGAVKRSGEAKSRRSTARGACCCARRAPSRPDPRHGRRGCGRRHTVRLRRKRISRGRPQGRLIFAFRRA